DHDNMVYFELVCQQIKGLEADSIDIDVNFFRLPLACKTEEVGDNGVTTLSLLPNLLEPRAHFRGTDIRGNEGFDGAQDQAEWLVQFVSHTGDEFAQGRELLGLHELLISRLEFGQGAV